MSTESIQETDDQPKPEFQPLTRVQRRVIGVLIEKSKTTPNAYPLTLNAITTGANQKSNRSPIMDLNADDVEMVLDELREIKAVVEIRGDGRVAKFKHRMYQWLGVEKVELAIVGELLLRGQQSLGDLRARAARMEPIAGLEGLKPLVRSLLDKGLMVELTPAGRGQIVTHNLYEPHELDHLISKAGSEDSNAASGGVQKIPATAASPAMAEPFSNTESELRKEIAELRAMVESLAERIKSLEQ